MWAKEDDADAKAENGKKMMVVGFLGFRGVHMRIHFRARRAAAHTIAPQFSLSTKCDQTIPGSGTGSSRQTGRQEHHRRDRPLASISLFPFPFMAATDAKIMLLAQQQHTTGGGERTIHQQ